MHSGRSVKICVSWNITFAYDRFLLHNHTFLGSTHQRTKDKLRKNKIEFKSGGSNKGQKYIGGKLPPK